MIIIAEVQDGCHREPELARNSQAAAEIFRLEPPENIFNGAAVVVDPDVVQHDIRAAVIYRHVVGVRSKAVLPTSLRSSTEGSPSLLLKQFRTRVGYACHQDYASVLYDEPTPLELTRPRSSLKAYFWTCDPIVGEA